MPKYRGLRVYVPFIDLRLHGENDACPAPGFPPRSSTALQKTLPRSTSKSRHHGPVHHCRDLLPQAMGVGFRGQHGSNHRVDPTSKGRGRQAPRRTGTFVARSRVARISSDTLQELEITGYGCNDRECACACLDSAFFTLDPDGLLIFDCQTSWKATYFCTASRCLRAS